MSVGEFCFAEISSSFSGQILLDQQEAEKAKGNRLTTNCFSSTMLAIDMSNGPFTLDYRLTRPNKFYFRTKLLEHLHLLDSHIVRHDDAALVPPADLSACDVDDHLGKSEISYFALPTVASEIPVLPTVPSKSTDPVWGCSNPCASASSMTEKLSM